MVGSMVASCLVGLRHLDTHLQTTRPQVAHCTMDWVVCFGYAPWRRRSISMESMLMIWVNLIEFFRVIFWYFLTTQMGWNRHLSERILSIPCISVSDLMKSTIAGQNNKNTKKRPYFCWTSSCNLSSCRITDVPYASIEASQQGNLGEVVCVCVWQDAPNQGHSGAPTSRFVTLGKQVLIRGPWLQV